MTTFAIDVANEAIVLIASLRSQRVAFNVLRRVRPDHFLDGRHQIVWGALRDVVLKQRVRPDLATMSRTCSVHGADETLIEYVRQLFEENVLIHDLSNHVEQLLFDALRWSLSRDVLPEFERMVCSPGTSVATLRSMARRLLEMASSRPGSNVLSGGQVLRDYHAEIAEREQRPGVFGLGFPAFDAMLGEGFRPTKTSLLGAVSSAGKTAVALNWAMGLARQGRSPAYCCYEIRHTQALDVIVSSHTGIPYDLISTGRLDAAQWRAVRSAAAEWSQRIRFIANPFTGPQEGRKTNLDNVNTLLSDVVDSGADVVFYDLFDRAFASDRPGDVKSALMAIQNGHKEINVHGVLLHQINLKALERRRDRRPTRDALEGIGVWVQICDSIYLLHRPAMFAPGAGLDDVMDVLCAKQRIGRWPWWTRWKWEGEIQRVSDPKPLEFDSDVFASISEIQTSA